MQSLITCTLPQILKLKQYLPRHSPPRFVFNLIHSGEYRRVAWYLKLAQWQKVVWVGLIWHQFLKKFNSNIINEWIINLSHETSIKFLLLKYLFHICLKKSRRPVVCLLVIKISPQFIIFIPSASMMITSCWSILLFMVIAPLSYSYDHLSKWFIIDVWTLWPRLQSNDGSRRVLQAGHQTYPRICLGNSNISQTICHKARIVLRLMVPIKTIIIPILLILAHPQQQTMRSFVKTFLLGEWNWIGH